MRTETLHIWFLFIENDQFDALFGNSFHLSAPVPALLPANVQCPFRTMNSANKSQIICVKLIWCVRLSDLRLPLGRKVYFLHICRQWLHILTFTFSTKLSPWYCSRVCGRTWIEWWKLPIVDWLRRIHWKRRCENCVSWLNGIVSGEFKRMEIRKKETTTMPMVERKEETINLIALRIQTH